MNQYRFLAHKKKSLWNWSFFDFLNILFRFWSLRLICYKLFLIKPLTTISDFDENKQPYPIDGIKEEYKLIK